MDKQPNILLILTDQQSASMMSCAGNSYLQTPSMDSLAARGTRFDLAFASNPVCVPSRFSMFTGYYPSAIGQRSNHFPEQLPESVNERGLGHEMAAAGYEVAYGGKEHLPGTDASKLGFEYFCDNERDELAAECASFLQRPHDRPFFLVSSFINPHDICYMAIRENAGEAHEQRLLERGHTELAAVDWALGLKDDYPDDVFWQEKCPPLPPNHEVQEDEPEAIGNQLVTQRAFRQAAREEWDESTWRLHRWVYHRLTERVDRQIQIVLDALENSGRAQDTIVIFVSDHGDHDAAHKLEHKTALYEEATRVPLIIADPTASGDRVDTEHLCGGIDILPTICDYAGASLSHPRPGSSLRPLVQQTKPDEWRDSLLIESEFGYGLRTPDRLYALYDEGANREQLYDLAIDPGQTRNFADDTGRAAEVEQLREKFQRTHHDLDDLAGTWDEHEKREFDEAVAPFSRVDEEMWQ